MCLHKNYYDRMRILFFASTPLNPRGYDHQYNGGGWIAAIHHELLDRKYELGFTFLSDVSDKYVDDAGTMYYPVKPIDKSFKEKIFNALHPRDAKYEIARAEANIHSFKKVVEDFNPDLIHIFGSEQCYGLIAKYTAVPVVIHLQGIINAYNNAFLIPRVSLMSYSLQNFNPYRIWARFQITNEWYRISEREREIFKYCHNYIGRTIWDKACIDLLCDDYNYYYGGEMLREPFYSAPKRKIPQRLTIVTTSSAAIYKGFDVILKTAKALYDKIGDGFEWIVYGNIDPDFYEKLTHISHKDVNVKLEGVVTAEQLVESCSRCTLYFHPSYIENSPNSLCEAQISGCPVVACHVGGIESLVAHGENGFLVPANDPYLGAYRILQLYEDNSLNLRMGNSARETAIKRHNRKEILDNVVNTYELILKQNKQ